MKDDGSSVKEWILRYAEQESSEEEEEWNGDGSLSPETDKKFDPVSHGLIRVSFRKASACVDDEFVTSLSRTIAI